MKQFLEKLRNYKYKWIVLSGSVFIIIFLVLVVSAYKKGLPITQLSPIIKQTEDNETNQTNLQKNLGRMYLIQVAPESGARNSVDYSEYIQFKFSEPVDISSLRFLAIPEIKLEPRILDKNPNIVVFIPKAGEIWYPRVNYALTIYRGLLSKNGNDLKEDIKYDYYNEPPATYMGGEK